MSNGTRQRVVASDELIPVDSIWVAGRVVLPPDLPDDAAFHVEGRGRRFGGPDGPSKHRVEVDSEGRFRVAFAAKTRRGYLRVNGRYLYMPTSLKITTAEPGGDIVLNPVLGGVFQVSLSLPTGLKATDLEGVEATLSMGDRPSGPEWTKSPDSDGKAEWTGLSPETTYSIKVASEKLPEVSRENIVIRAGEVTEFKMPMTLGVSVSGRVLTEGSRPVVDAKVQLSSDEGMGTAIRRKGVTTNIHGEFEFTGVHPGQLSLGIRSSGYLASNELLGSAKNGDRLDELTCTLSAGKAISGIVTLEDGRGVPGIMVEATHVDSLGHQAYQLDQQSAKTNAQGRFRITGLAALPVLLSASSRSRPDADSRGRFRRGNKAASTPSKIAREEGVEPGRTDVHLVLTQGGVIAGTVQDVDGNPIKRFQIQAIPGWSGSSINSREDQLSGTFRDGSGSFSLTGLKPGSWAVSVQARGFARLHDIVVQVPTDSPVHFELERPATIGGVVHTPDGKPAPGARVTITPINPGRNSGHIYSSLTTGRARFRLTGLNAGEYTISAVAPDWLESEVTTTMVEPGEEQGELVLVLKTPCVVTGVLKAGVGRIVNRTLKLSGRSRSTNDTVYSDAGGMFTSRNLEPGTYTAVLLPVEGEVEDGDCIRANPLTVEFDLASGVTTHIEFLPEPLKLIQVSGVVSIDNQPVPNCMVVFSSAAFRQFHTTTTDALGNYSLTVDGRGKYHARVSPPNGWSRHKFRFRVYDVGQHKEDFDLYDGRLAVTILRESGSPAEGVEVSMMPKNGFRLERSESFAITDKTGVARFKELQPGKYVLAVTSLPPERLPPVEVTVTGGVPIESRTMQLVE